MCSVFWRWAEYLYDSAFHRQLLEVVESHRDERSLKAGTAARANRLTRVAVADSRGLFVEAFHLGTLPCALLTHCGASLVAYRLWPHPIENGYLDDEPL